MLISFVELDFDFDLPKKLGTPGTLETVNGLEFDVEKADYTSETSYVFFGSNKVAPQLLDSKKDSNTHKATLS